MDGPCTRPPIKETLLEIPGGQVALAEMGAKVDQAMDIGMTQMMAKRLEEAQGPMIQRIMNTPMMKQVKYYAFMAKGARDKWMSYAPEKSYRHWVYTAASLGFWFL